MKKRYSIRVEEDAYNWYLSKWEGNFTKWFELVYNKVMEAKNKKCIDTINPITEAPIEEKIKTDNQSVYTDNQIAFVKSLKLKSKNEYTDEDWFTISLEKFLEVYHKDKENLRPLIIELS